MTSLRAIGLMSGTSLDGVDVALVDTDGERIEKLGPTGYRAYAPKERELLRAALADAGKSSTAATAPAGWSRRKRWSHGRTRRPSSGLCANRACRRSMS